MVYIKRHIPVFLIGVLGGFFAFLVTAKFIGAGYLISSGLEAKINDYYQKDKNSQKADLPPVQSDAWQKIAANEALSSVAVQLFQNNSLVKQGSGIVLSSDGLIATVPNLVPAGSFYYQVIYGDKVLRAAVLARDYKNNLALIKVQAQDLNVSGLDAGDYQSGREFVLTGKFVNVSRAVTFSQRALINYALEKEILLDTAFNNFLNGAKVVDGNGKMAGMAYVRYGKVYLSSSSVIQDFLTNQLSKNSKPAK